MKFNKYHEAIRNMHTIFGHPVADKPTAMPVRRRINRVNWMIEEVNEFLVSDTLADQVDALVDLLVFLMGNAVETGVDLDPIFDIVHKANMSKLWPDGKPRYREGDGKIIKPPGWESPEPLIAQEIERQSV